LLLIRSLLGEFTSGLAHQLLDLLRRFGGHLPGLLACYPSFRLQIRGRPVRYRKPHSERRRPEPGSRLAQIDLLVSSYPRSARGNEGETTIPLVNAAWSSAHWA
jgi:hypothetical protein